MSNGENESNVEPELSQAEKQLLQSTTYLDNYMENTVGLGRLESSPVADLLKLSQEKLRKMSPEDCSEGAYLLTQEALFVQNEINKHQAQLDFARTRLKRTIAPYLQDYGGKYATTETREILAIKENAYAQDLQKIVDRCERIIARLSYIPNQLHNLSRVLMDYRHGKIAHMKGEQ